MGLWSARKYVDHVKSVSACVVFIGGCWFMYQLREISEMLRSTVATNVLTLEQKQAQYIYLDDPKFKDLFVHTNENDLQSSISEKPRTFSKVITKWWKSLNRSLAFRLVHIAKNGLKEERSRAIYTLGSLKHLKDWHYQQLAQMLDAKTAVGLARIADSDLRFFLKPPYSHIRKKLYEIIDELHQLLQDMDKLCENHHTCLTRFLKKSFQEFHRDELVLDHDLSSVGIATGSGASWDQQLLQNCIQAIYHHSSIEQFSRAIAVAGGLPVLMEVQQRFSNDIDLSILLAKIISNLSLHSEYLDDIYRSGWIGVLASWARHEDVRVAAPAARALANLDVDFHGDEKFHKRIYLLHPMHRVSTKPELDAIFIHGLLGGIFVSWRQRNADFDATNVENSQMAFETETLNLAIGDQPNEFIKDLAHDMQLREWKQISQDYEIVLDDCPVSMNSRACGPFTCKEDDYCVEQRELDLQTRTECWPKDWLPEDLPHIRVIGINYDTNLSLWSLPCPIESMRSTLDERSNEFTKKLLAAGVGKRPVVWICHSMGGLLVKRMLVEEWKKGDPHELCKQTKAIFFYSTPHRGSHIAALKRTTQMLVWPSIEVQELREESPKLLKLHEDFLKMLEESEIEIVSFSETKPTPVTALKFPLQFVTPKSADPGVGEFYEIPQDHLYICKPAHRQSFLYRKVLSVLEAYVSKS
ncbi:protein SERAC1 [Diachasma alloeum]|uniref:protein SERAC1 n=1 Tax=Diachasma alloeum TaxID=454923 RepID=UPI0007383AAC|nr:protein SERAC1 [Diachasma alloeum]